MKKIFFIVVLLPLFAQAHPGIGIVKDGKGNIYYTDLQHVWKITNGIRTIVVPNVHTHELYVDQNDNLYGEGGYFDEKANRFYHYLWVYRPGGQIDTVIGMKEAYVRQDFSLARDKHGNEYYIKQFLRQPDTSHIYRKPPGGKETVFATGNFKGVKWLHPQDNGSLLYILGNSIYRVEASGKIHLIKENIGSASPSFELCRPHNTTVWSAWEDKAQNVYVAVFSDQVVKRIDANGNVSDFYKSTENWAPLHGVFDNGNNLWVLESSDKNEVRVTIAETMPTGFNKSNSHWLPYIGIGLVMASMMVIYFAISNFNSKVRTLEN